MVVVKGGRRTAQEVDRTDPGEEEVAGNIPDPGEGLAAPGIVGILGSEAAHSRHTAGSGELPEEGTGSEVADHNSLGLGEGAAHTPLALVGEEVDSIDPAGRSLAGEALWVPELIVSYHGADRKECTLLLWRLVVKDQEALEVRDWDIQLTTVALVRWIRHREKTGSQVRKRDSNEKLYRGSVA